MYNNPVTHFCDSAAPVIEWEEESNSLICHLNDTGGYRHLWVSFTREDEGRNITVGHCSRDSIREYVHGGMIINFNSTLNACVLELPNPVRQQDAGNYSCSLLVTKSSTESEKIAIVSHGRAIVTGGTPQPTLLPIIGGVLGSFMVLVLFSAAFMLLLFACHRRRRIGNMQ